LCFFGKANKKEANLSKQIKNLKEGFKVHKALARSPQQTFGF
jgi:hypothetical protein